MSRAAVKQAHPNRHALFVGGVCWLVPQGQPAQTWIKRLSVIPPGTNGEATKSEAASGMRLRFLLSSLVVRMVPPRSTKTKRWPAPHHDAKL